MLKGKHTVIGFETYGKEAYKTNKNQGFLGNGITHTRTGLCKHEFSLCVQARSCVHRFLPRNPNQHRNRAETKNVKSSNLSCLKTERKPKTNLSKQM